jgi:hypothetical protein
LTGSCWKISVMISCGIFDIFLRFFLRLERKKLLPRRRCLLGFRYLEERREWTAGR